MKIKQLKYLFAGLLLAVSFSACESYEEYITDYDFSAVYFGSQRPIRTLVAKESAENLTFKAGVVLAGLRKNTKDQWASIEIAPDLVLSDSLSKLRGLLPLPTDWYTTNLVDNKIIIPKGEFLGDFSITIDKSKFTADPLALTNKYALAIRITGTSADSILSGDATLSAKNYTIIVVKYISENSGTYYARGQQTEMDAVGDTITGTTKKYYYSDWIKNKTRVFTTLNLNDNQMGGMGFDNTDKMNVTFGAGKAVTLTSSSISPASIVTDLGSTYDSSTGIFHFIYKFVKSSKTYKVDEYLKLRNNPENDLRFEEWN